MMDQEIYEEMRPSKLNLFLLKIEQQHLITLHFNEKQFQEYSVLKSNEILVIDYLLFKSINFLQVFLPHVTIKCY